MIGYVYGLFDPRQFQDWNDCRYIGQTSTSLNKRLGRHVGAARTESKRHTYVNRWIGSLLDEGVRPQIILFDSAFLGDLDDLETWWIATGRALGWNLTNYQSGGRNNMLRPDARAKLAANGRGRRHTEEHKARISASHMGISPTPEVRKRISDTLTGRKNGPPSEETRKKIGDAHRGKTISEGQRAFMSEFGTRRFADPAARAAYSELMSSVMADPEVRQHISEVRLAQMEQKRLDALANHSEDDAYVNSNKTIRFIIGTRCDWLCYVCGGFIDTEIPYPDPKAFTIALIEPVPKGQPRTIGNSVATHRECQWKMPR